jgi:hypothetical protein
MQLLPTLYKYKTGAKLLIKDIAFDRGIFYIEKFRFKNLNNTDYKSHNDVFLKFTRHEIY